MTLAEYIVSKSTLPSGTIFDHILAMQTGGGQSTVFASMFSVSVEQPSVVVTRRAKQPEPEAVLPILQAHVKQDGKKNNDYSVFTVTPVLSVHTEQDEINVTSKTQRASVITRLSITDVSKGK